MGQRPGFIDQKTMRALKGRFIYQDLANRTPDLDANGVFHTSPGQRPISVNLFSNPPTR